MTKETLAGPVNGSVKWGYNNDFNVTRLTIPGASINLAYDADGLPTQIGEIILNRDQQTGFLTGTALGTITDAGTVQNLSQILS